MTHANTTPAAASPTALGNGVVRAIASCATHRGTMVETDECTVTVGGGLTTEPHHKGLRGVTLLSVESWSAACRDVYAALPWYTRRANVLVEGLDLGALVGKLLTIGDVRLLIHGETKPCGFMDKSCAGLRDALVPEFRGGLYGEVLAGGRIRIGDSVRILHP